MKKSDFFFEYNSPLVMFDVKGKEVKRASDHSVYNEAEVNVIVTILRNIIDVNEGQEGWEDKLKSIGIITGYNAQVTLITDKLSEIYGQQCNALDFIEIDSVDGFQGKEKDLIILSCVRSNNQRDIGFMRDDRRLNVALTRARRGLIVIGNADTLSGGDKLWANFIAFMRNSGRVVDAANIEQHLRSRFREDIVDESSESERVLIECLAEELPRQKFIEAVVS